MKRLLNKLLATILTVSLLLSPVSALADIDEVIVAAEVSEEVRTGEEFDLDLESDPAPVAQEPAPVAEEPAPVAEEPAPVVEDPTPVIEEPAPAVEEPAPAAEEPSDAEGEPAPAADEQAPAAEDESAPKDDTVGEPTDAVEPASEDGSDEVIYTDVVEAIVPEAVDMVVEEAAYADLPEVEVDAENGLEVVEEAAANGVVFEGGEQGQYTITYNNSGENSFFLGRDGQTANTANAGEILSFSTSTSFGYELTKVTVTSADDASYEERLTPDQHTFTMPAHSIIVTPEFTYNVHTGTYTIEVQGGPQGGGSAYVDNVAAASANENETVTLRYGASQGYTVTGVILTYGGESHDVGLITTFVMPAAAVTVSFNFSESGNGSGSGDDQPGGGNEGESYDIEIANCNNGFISVTCMGNPVTSAKAGQYITIVAEPNVNYTCSDVTVNFGDHQEHPSAYYGGFTMPTKPVTISATFTSIAGSHQIQMPENANGTVTARKNGNCVTSANKGDYIWIEFQPNGGFRPGSVTVTCDGHNVEMEDENGFYMPEGDVTVTATFISLVGQYEIATSCEHGTITAMIQGYSVTSANEGDRIDLDCQPTYGYHLNSLSVTGANGQNVPVESRNGWFSFTMPGSAVTVSATFVQGTHTITAVPGDYGLAIFSINGVGVTSADKDERVYLGLGLKTPDPSLYRARSYTVMCGDTKQTVTTEGDKSYFIMPDGNVTVTADIISTTAGHLIDIKRYGYAMVAAYVSGYNYEFGIEPHALAGETVEIRFCDADEGDRVNTFSLTTSTGTNVDFNRSWEDNEDYFTFTMPNDDVIVKATAIHNNVPLKYYNIGIDGNITHGSVSADIYGQEVDSAEEGATVHLNVTPGEGYKLDSLSVEQGTTTVTLNEDNEFTMPAGNVTVTASFVEDSVPATHYSIDINDSIANGSVTAKVNGVAVETAAKDDEVTLVVKPDEGYELAHDGLHVYQNGDEVSLTNNNTFTMPDGDVTVAVSFSAISYDVTVKDPENGSVSCSPTSFSFGDKVEFSLTPAEHYELDTLTVSKDSGGMIPCDGDGEGGYSFTMPASNVTITATFKAIKYSVTIDSSLQNGTLTVDKATAAYGETVTLTATPADGYELAEDPYRFSIDGETGSGSLGPSNGNKLTMPAGNVTVSVIFVKKNYEIHYGDMEYGSVGAKLNGESANYVTWGETLTLIVEPDPGYELDTMAVTDSNGKEVTVTDNSFTMPKQEVTISATFRPIDYAINVSPVTNGSVIAQQNGVQVETAHYLETVYLNVTPADGYELESLTVTGPDGDVPCDETYGVYQFTMPAGDVSVSASFVEDESEKTYAITVDYNENGEGYAKLNEETVTTAKAGTTLSFSFYPHDGYEPVGASVKYSNGEEYVYIDNPTGGAIATFEMPADDVTITLEFKAIGGNNQGGSDTPGGLVGPIITDATYQVNYPSSGDGFTAAVGYNGTQVQSAEAGWVLKLYVQASSFNFSITDATGEPVDYDYKEGGYEFTMPASHVTIAISANGGSGGSSGDPVPVAGGEHSITITDSEHGKAYAQRNGTYVFSANKDDSIRIEPRPNQYYQPTGVTVTDQSGKVINGYSGTGPYDPWAFTMPGGPVTVTVNYVYSVNIVVNPDNFPDENMQNALMRYAHQEGSDYVVSSGNISYLELNNVSNYKGLELLTNLTRLVISGDQLTTLTLQNDVITSVMLANCGNLTTVDLSDCPNLNDLNFEWNTPKISSLNVSGCTKLTSLQARGAALKTLDVSHNTELTHLDCNSNQLTTLDVSKNTKLESLSCFSNNITQLNLVKNSRLLEYITEENKRDIDDTQEGYTCVAYVNPETEEWVLAHDPGVQVSLAPMFDIVKAYADEGEPRGTIEAPSAAPAGRTVTVTVVPNEGYALQGIEVTDDTGAIIQITDVSEGVYTFTMPEGEVTITARFIPTLVITAPEAIPDLVYNGQAQALVTAAETNGGTLQYSLDGENWGKTIPTGTDVGSYNVYYQVIDSDGYYGDGTGAEPITVEIARKPVNVTAANQSKTYGETDPELTYTADGLIGTDKLTGLLGREEGEDVGEYAITQGTLFAGNNYEIILNDATLTITRKALTVTAEDKTKVYGEDDPTLTWTTEDLVGEDKLTGNLTRAAGENVGEYAITQGTLAATDNYEMSFVPGKLTITKKALTVTAEDKTKVYGDTDPELTWTAPGLVGDDTLTGTLTRVEGEDVKEGGYAIEQGTLAATDNYQMSFVPGKLTINKKALTVTAMPRTKVYGESDPKLTYTVTGLVGDDKVSGELERVAGENVQEGGYAIGKGSLTAGGNYDIAYTGSTLTITPAALTVTPDALSKTYGDDNPEVLSYTAVGLANGDTKDTALSGKLERATGDNAGEYAIMQGTLAATANYNLTFTDGVKFTIRPKKVTAVADAKSKTYGEKDPDLAYTVADGQLVGSDTQAEVLTGSLTRAAGENVGSYAITKGTLKSASDNYELVFQTARLTINKKALAVTAEDKTKTYGDADPTLTWTAPDLVEGDALTGALTRAEGEDVGEYAITQGTLDAGDNYTMVFTPGKLTVNQRKLTVTPDAVEKTYGETDPALTYTVAGELVGADALTGALERAEGETAGTYAIARGTLSAGDNYDIELGTAALTINKRPLTITIDAKAKLLDADDPDLTYTVTGLAAGDEATIKLTRDSGETVGAYPISLASCAIKKGDSDVTESYDVTCNDDAKLTIGNNVINVTAKAAAKTYGAKDPELEYEAAIPEGGALTGALGRVQGEDAGTYAITQGTLQPNAGYVLNFVGANLTIEKAALTVTPDDAEKTYGEADPELTYAVDGLVNGDAAEAVLTGALGRETGENAGTYAIAQGTLAANNNYTLTVATDSKLTIAAKALTVTAKDAEKTYGNADPAFDYDVDGLVNGDAKEAVLEGALSREAGVDVNEAGYAITQGTLQSRSYNYTVDTFVPAKLVINKKDITVKVTAPPKSGLSKAYGDNDPEFEYEAANGAVVAGDTLTISREAGEKVGLYAFTADNANYNVAFKDGESEQRFEITPKPLTGLTWSTEGLVYNGSGLKPTATVIGNDLEEGDTCYVNVNAVEINGQDGKATVIDAVDAGEYTAEAASLTNPNYMLPVNSEITRSTFAISKAPGEAQTVAREVTVSFHGVKDGRVDLTNYLKDATAWSVKSSDALITAAAPEGNALVYSTMDTEGTEISTGSVVINVQSKNYNDSTLTVNFRTSTAFALRFESNGGPQEASRSLAAGDKIKDYLPAAAERDGYELKGWYLDAALTDPVSEYNAMGESDATVYAKWAPITYTIQLTDPDGYHSAEDNLNPITYTVATDPSTPSLTLPILKDNKSGLLSFTFIGWKELGEAEDVEPRLDVTIDPASMVNTTYVAQWKQGEVAGKVAFENAGGGSGLQGVQGLDSKNEASTDDDAPTTSLANAMKAIANENMTEETADSKITVEMNISASSKDAEAKAAIKEAVAPPQAEGVTQSTDFMEITITSETTMAAEGPTEDPVVLDQRTVSDAGRVVEIPLKYDMTGRYNPVITRHHRDENGTSVTPLRRLTRRPSGSEMKDGTFYIEGSGANATVYVYSQLFSTLGMTYDDSGELQVYFDYNNGTAPQEVVVRENEKLQRPEEDPVREGNETYAYVFDKWYADPACKTPYNFDAPVTRNNMTVYAGWKRYAIVDVTVEGFNGKYDKAEHNVTVKIENDNPDIDVYFGEAELTKENYKDGSMTVQSETMPTEKTYHWYAEATDCVANPASGVVTINVQKLPSAVTTAPRAQSLTYNGGAQALVSAGKATGGTLKYALGTSGSSAPASGWSASVPTAVNAGTYYVWYKVEGTSVYADVKPTCVTVTVSAPAAQAAPQAATPQPEPIPTIPVLKKSVKKTISAAPGSVYQIELGGKTGKSFKSSKKKVATVSATGLMTVKAAGKTKITLKVGKKKRTLILKVKDPTVPTRIALNAPGGTAVKVGESQTLTVTLPEGTNSGIKWKSSNKKIATVNAQGVVTFKKAGKVTITATAVRGKKKAKVKFKVSK